MTPELLIVVDTEEEFDWTAALLAREPSRRARSRPRPARTKSTTASASSRPMSSTIRSRPTRRRSRFLRGLQRRRQGRDRRPSPSLGDAAARRGGHTRNSYHCNLPPELERAKIEALTDAIEAASASARPSSRRAATASAPNTAQGAGRSRLPGRLQPACRTPICPATAARISAARPTGRYWLDEAAACSKCRSASASSAPLRGLGAKARLAVRQSRAPSGCACPACSRAAGLRRPLAADPGRRAGRRAMPADRGDGAARPPHSSASPITARASSPATRPMSATRPISTASSPSIETVLAFFRDAIGGRFTTLSRVHARTVADSAAQPPEPSPRTAAARRGWSPPNASPKKLSAYQSGASAASAISRAIR